MRESNFYVALGYRAALLASVATMAANATLAQTIVNSGTVVVTSAADEYQITAGQTLINLGSITRIAQAYEPGAPAAIDVSGDASTEVINNGRIQALNTLAGTFLGGIGVNVLPGGSAGAIINNATGTFTSSGTSTVGIEVGALTGAANVGTISNLGLINVSGGDNAAILVLQSGSVGVINNAAAGRIEASTLASATVFTVSGTIGTLNNAGQITSIGDLDINIFGSIGGINNTGLIATKEGDASAIDVGYPGTVGVINNIGTAAIIVGSDDAIAMTSPGPGPGGIRGQPLPRTIGAIINSGTIMGGFGPRSTSTSAGQSSMGSPTNLAG